MIISLLILFFLTTNILPEIDSFNEFKQSESVKIYSREGVLLRDTLSSLGGRRQFNNLNKEASFVKLLLNTEDSRFYYHPGVDLLSVGRALYQNLVSGEVLSGASTITMQLVRMRYGLERTLKSKIIESLMAFYLEMSLSKDEILELYVNNLPFSNEIYGVGEASQVYFNKSQNELSIAESAFLIAIIRAPTELNPYINSKKIHQIKDRILSLNLLEYHSREKLTIHNLENNFLAPHFTDYVLRNRDHDHVVKTTLDLPLQNSIIKVIERHLQKLEDMNVGQASVLVIDNKTAEVLSYVGSKNYWDEKTQGMIYGIIQKRQPGST